MRYSANEAVGLFVFLDTVLLVPQIGEGVDHDTRDDVSEEHSHKHVVENIKDEPGSVESRNIISYLFAYVEGDDALSYGLAVLFWNVFRVHRLHIRVETENGEYHYEGESQE